jgi:hypothetical protein
MSQTVGGPRDIASVTLGIGLGLLTGALSSSGSAA